MADQALDGAYLSCQISNVQQWGFVDSGAVVSIISTTAANDMGLIIEASDQTLSLDTSDLPVMGQIKVSLSIATYEVSARLLVADIPVPVLVGRDLVKKICLVVDLADRTFWSTKLSPTVKFPLVIRERIILEEDDCPQSSPDGLSTTDTPYLESLMDKTTDASIPSNVVGNNPGVSDNTKL